jgi:hypothetical protein
MKWKINMKGRKKEKNKKNLVPTGFEPGRCGGRSWAPCHWAR